MNAVISLCHFCELHGPSVLFSTQAYHDASVSLTPEQKSFYGNVESLSCKNRKVNCEACQSLDSSKSGFISNDHEGRISYLSTQQPMQCNVALLVHQACIRSLSCEVSPGKEGTVFFGDEQRGHVLSRTFFLRDAQARGFHRWFSVTVLARDKLYLLHSWPFFTEQIATLVTELQEKAAQVYAREQTERPQRALRLSAANGAEPLSNKASRSPSELTGDPRLLPRLHLRFSWLLRAAADRLVERMPAPPPSLEPALLHHETEEGFTLVYTEQSLQEGAEAERSSSAPTITSLRQLRKVVGVEPFLSLCYALLVGLQVVVRGQPLSIVTSVVRCLSDLVPSVCCRLAINSEEYLEPGRSNLLGLETKVAVPRPSAQVVRLDILPPDTQDFPEEPEKYSYKIAWSGEMPAKCPTLLSKMEKAIENEILNDSVLVCHFEALKEEWLNIATVIGRLDQTSVDSSTFNSLLQTLGVQEHDKTLLQFWAKSLSKSR